MKLHITERAINSVAIPEGRRQMLVFDEELSGFAVSLSKGGARSYVIVYRDAKGTQRQEKMAGVGAVSAVAARAMARARLAELAQARGPAPRARRPSCPVMDRFFFDMLLPIVKLERRSHETHASIYRNHISPILGQKRLDDVTEEDIIAFNTHLKQKRLADGKWKKVADKRLAEGTIKRILILLRQIFNEARRRKDIPVHENPTHALSLTTTRKVKGVFLSAKQLRDLMAAAEESQNPTLADIIRVCGATGLRRENVLSMRWEWFDEERGTLAVPPEADKAKKGFVLHLASSVVDLLRAKRKEIEGPWVFPNPKTGKPYSSCYNAWVTARDKANLPNLRMHDLRHTFASMMLDSGADIVDVQQALAHTQLKTTAVYLHLTDKRKREHANAAATATGLFA